MKRNEQKRWFLKIFKLFFLWTFKNFNKSNLGLLSIRKNHILVSKLKALGTEKTNKQTKSEISFYFWNLSQFLFYYWNFSFIFVLSEYFFVFVFVEHRHMRIKIMRNCEKCTENMIIENGMWEKNVEEF